MQGKKRIDTYNVRHVQQAPRQQAPTRATETQAPRPAVQSRPEQIAQEPTPPAQVTAPTSIMMSALCAAVDYLAEAQVYATRKGLHITFTGEDVRAMANTLYINAKGGR